MSADIPDIVIFSLPYIDVGIDPKESLIGWALIMIAVN